MMTRKISASTRMALWPVRKEPTSTAFRRATTRAVRPSCPTRFLRRRSGSPDRSLCGAGAKRALVKASLSASGHGCAGDATTHKTEF
eukprot:scaffold379_cov235-Pinguiococcus_pyrenoidosus.AAC.19